MQDGDHQTGSTCISACGHNSNEILSARPMFLGVWQSKRTNSSAVQLHRTCQILNGGHQTGSIYISACQNDFQFGCMIFGVVHWVTGSIKCTSRLFNFFSTLYRPITRNICVSRFSTYRGRHLWFSTSGLVAQRLEYFQWIAGFMWRRETAENQLKFEHVHAQVLIANL